MQLNSLKSRSSIVILVAVLILLVAGCGGSSDSGSTGSSSESTSGFAAVTISKKVYVKKAAQICKDVPKHYVERVEALKAEFKGKQKLTKPEETLKAAVPPLQRAIKELQALGLPKGDEPKMKAIVNAMEAGIEGLEEKPRSELSGPKSPFDKFQKLSLAYGLEYCPSL